MSAEEITEAALGARYAVIAGWDDAPHLTDEAKARYLEKIPPSHQGARTKGSPHLGSGQIYPVSEEFITCDPIVIEKNWPRCYALDTGWKDTACVWAAWDRLSDVVYIYSVYKQGQVQHPVHAAAILAKGKWIPGVGDAAAKSNMDGRQFIEIYQDLGLNIQLPNKAVETGIAEVWNRLSTGRLKIFPSCTDWFDEFRTYIRDENGNIVKKNDHLMDATRYLIMSGLDRAKVQPEKKERNLSYAFAGGQSWMGT